MTISITMPALSPTMEEGNLAKWHVKVGDKVKAGDIIVKVDGKTIDKPADLQRLIGATKPGSKTSVQIFRRGSYKDVVMVVGELEADKSAGASAEPSTSAAAKSSLGLAVTDLNDSQKRELRLKGGVRVDAASDAAARAGLREGDVIVSLGNLEVSNVKEFEQLVSKMDKTKPVSVLFRRGELTRFALIKPNS